MPRKYPAAAFGITPTAPPTSNPPPMGFNPNYPPTNAPAANVGFQPQPYDPSTQAAPQFYSPPVVQGGYQPTITNQFMVPPQTQPGAFQNPTYVPDMEPLPDTVVRSTNIAQPPINKPILTGPRHAPPPTVDATQPPTSADYAAQQTAALRGKRPVAFPDKTQIPGSPSLSEFGGHMPQQQVKSPSQMNLTTASPVPNPSWAPDKRYAQASLESWPTTNEVLDKTGLPFGIVFHPLAETGAEVPVINFGECNIIRCKRCRAYVNPYVSFVEGGKRWKCNICYYLNDVPREYFSVVGNDGLRFDQAERPELNHSVVEFIASTEFMHRPPQPPIYYFLIDVSYTAVVSGMVRAVCNSIKQAIQNKLLLNERTKVGFITYDSTIHFYNLRPGLSNPQMLVVPEIEQPFSPHAEDLLVNLKDSKELVDKLLTDLLPNLFQQGQENASALGPALHCAFNVMNSQGGKMVVFQSVLPSLGVGKLPERQTVDTSAKLLQPGEQYYKNLALEFSKSQIGCDLFFFTPKYIDVATIACLAKFTGGEVNYYYLDKFAANEASRLQNDVYRTLTRNTGFEALMRIRCSKGLSIDLHHGSFFIRAQDLLNLPNVDADKAYSLRMKVTDPKNFISSKNIAKDGKYYATIQAGLLYTTSSGERRIRIVTKCCPLTDQVSELYRDADEQACISLIGKFAVSRAVEDGIPKALSALNIGCSNILALYAKNSGPAQASGSLMLPNTLLRFPLLCLSIIKNSMLRSDTPVDERIASILRFETLSVQESILWLYPNLYNLTNLPEENTGVLPPTIELSTEKLDQRGIFLLDNGLYFLLWIGSMVDPAILQALFNINSLAEVDEFNNQLQLVRLENPYSARVNDVLDLLRCGRTGYTWLYPIKEKDPLERKFFTKLIHDRFPDASSYHEFISELKTFVSQRQTGR